MGVVMALEPGGRSMRLSIGGVSAIDFDASTAERSKAGAESRERDRWRKSCAAD
jgi:hypothetical protein